MQFAPSADDSEELARAEVYGLLSQLFYAPPDESLHGQLQVAVTEAPARGGYLEASWGEFVSTARQMPREAVVDEYAALFQGIGKPEVFLYGSYHVAGALNEKPLVALRSDLAALGLERSESMFETEDHIAYLCEVMRFLIAGDDAGVCNLTSQRRFFDAHLRPWADRLWDSLEAHPQARFYRALGGFARDFTAVEGQAFDLLDAA
jgi:TorA maturation chaperone TorD